MTEDLEVQCYAIRRLNPFLGVLQVVEIPVARATTTNGLAWHIELLVDKRPGWGSLAAADGEKEWCLYGLWSMEEGLVTSPSSVPLDDSHALAVCEQLVETVQACQSGIPYKLADNQELWLLDAAEKKPLALLYSKCPGGRSRYPEPRYWKGCIGREGTPGQRRFPEIARLEAAVRSRAGSNPARLWVSWDAGHGRVEDAEGAEIPAERFPVYGIREDGNGKDYEALVGRYIDWVSPALLTIPYLDEACRARLESSLDKQACSIEYHWRLYPAIMDENKITAARVQARLQASATGLEGLDDRRVQ